jgi:hypothetical protein
VAFVNPQRWNRWFAYSSTVIAVSDSADQTLVRREPSRWSLTFSAVGQFGGVAGPVLLGTTEQPNGDTLYALTDRGQDITLDFDTFGGLVTEEWHGLSQTGTPDMAIIEVFFRPKGVVDWEPSLMLPQLVSHQSKSVQVLSDCLKKLMLLLDGLS